MTNRLLINFGDQSITEIDAPKKLDQKTKGACVFFQAAKATTWVFVAKGTERREKEHWGALAPKN